MSIMTGEESSILPRGEITAAVGPLTLSAASDVDLSPIMSR